MKKIKRLIVILITVISGYVGLFAPALQVKADVSEFIPALVASAPLVAEDSLLVATLANPVTFVLGSSLLLCGVVYANRQSIENEGQRFQNYLHSTGQDISDWYNTGDNSITTDSNFNDEATKFISQEGNSSGSVSQPIDNAVSSAGTSSANCDPILNLPVGNYTLDVSKLVAMGVQLSLVSNNGLSIMIIGASFTAHVSEPDIVCTSGTFSLTVNGDGTINYSMPSTQYGGTSYTTSNNSSNVYLQSPANTRYVGNVSLPFAKISPYVPSTVVSGGATTAGAVPAPVGTVFKPAASGTTVGSVVGATPASLTQSGVVTPPGNNNDSSGFEKLLEGALITLAGALSGNLAQTQYGWQITTKSNTINITEASNETQESESQLREEAKDVAQDYKLPDDWYNGHIVAQHGPNSQTQNSSKFNENFDIKKGIEDTLQIDDTVEVKGNTADPDTGEERDGYILEKTYDTPIGITSKGKPCSRLKVVLGDDGFIVTAYPVK